MTLTKHFASLMVAALLLTGCMVQAANPPVAPQAGHWQTWVLASSDEVRPAAPPDQSATLAEIAEIKSLAAQKDDEAEAQVAYWNAGSPSYRWIQIALNQFKSKPMSNPRVARGMAMMNIAIYDAMVAAWDAKYTYNRPRPTQVDPSLTTLADVPNSPSYPAEHAVAAGAAAAILGYIYPDDAQSFDAKAEEAAQSRVLAGVQYPSDVQAGLELGRQVAERVIARAQTDGSDAKWDGTMPTEPGHWTGEKPVEPLAGTWKTWVLSSGDELRPAPPLAYDSPELAAQLQEVESVTHTWQMDQKALYWQVYDSIFPLWYGYAGQYIFEDHLDSDPPQAANIYAAMSAAQYDAIVACWDAKYTYWAIRPFQLDPGFKTLFPTPNHPSYPSSHSCDSSAIAGVLAAFFPANASFLEAQVQEMSESRIYAGLHFRSDIEAGLTLGRAVAQKTVEVVQSMSQP